MRTMIFLLALALITSCRSHKELQQDKSLAVDSVARSEHHRTIAVIDSAIRNIDFSFDTLKNQYRAALFNRRHRRLSVGDYSHQGCKGARDRPAACS